MQRLPLNVAIAGRAVFLSHQEAADESEWKAEDRQHDAAASELLLHVRLLQCII